MPDTSRAHPTSIVPTMDAATLKQICRKNNLFGQPALNDTLYLHFQGFMEIGPGLAEYTGLRVLWLEGNRISKVENLEALIELRTLYLNDNMLTKIEGLDKQIALASLHLENNSITCLENLSQLTTLKSIYLKGNDLKETKDVEHLSACPSIETLDLHSNKLEDPSVLTVLASLPALRGLHLQGNPVVRKIKNYRKAVIWYCKELRYLDDRPVMDRERIAAQAYMEAIEAGTTDQEAAQAELRASKQHAQQRDAAELKAVLSLDDVMSGGGVDTAELEEEALEEQRWLEKTNQDLTHHPNSWLHGDADPAESIFETKFEDSADGAAGGNSAAASPAIIEVQAETTTMNTTVAVAAAAGVEATAASATPMPQQPALPPVPPVPSPSSLQAKATTPPASASLRAAATQKAVAAAGATPVVVTTDFEELD